MPTNERPLDGGVHRRHSIKMAVDAGWCCIAMRLGRVKRRQGMRRTSKMRRRGRSRCSREREEKGRDREWRKIGQEVVEEDYKDEGKEVALTCIL